MATSAEEMKSEKKSATSRAEFIRLAGIRPELAEFVTEFVEKPDKFISMPIEKRCKIENQIDAFLLPFDDEAFFHRVSFEMLSIAPPG